MTRRPRGVSRHYWFQHPLEYRRRHVRCCMSQHVTCPVCGVLDPECNDLCGCYRRDEEAWRTASFAKMDAIEQAQGPR